jgi:hypothetical protein
MYGRLDLLNKMLVSRAAVTRESDRSGHENIGLRLRFPIVTFG